MKVNDNDALDYSFRDSSNAVTAELQFEETQACVELGITYAHYLTLPGSPIWLDEQTPMSKCDVIMWYRYRKIVPSVLEDMAARKVRKK